MSSQIDLSRVINLLKTTTDMIFPPTANMTTKNTPSNKTSEAADIRSPYIVSPIWQIQQIIRILPMTESLVFL
ncbi:hypothetical protein AB7X73_01905 [Providencia rettgeri]